MSDTHHVTLAVLIGNSDDRLSQQRWAAYVAFVDTIIAAHRTQAHFTGCSASAAERQNACWVFEIDRHEIHALDRQLDLAREHYDQDAIALLEGATRMIAS